MTFATDAGLEQRAELLDSWVEKRRQIAAGGRTAGRIAQGSIEYAFTDAAFLERGHPRVLEAFREGAVTAAGVSSAQAVAAASAAARAATGRAASMRCSSSSP